MPEKTIGSTDETSAQVENDTSAQVENETSTQVESPALSQLAKPHPATVDQDNISTLTPGEQEGEDSIPQPSFCSTTCKFH